MNDTERASAFAQVAFEDLLSKDKEQAMVFQENAERLIAIAKGTIKPMSHVMRLVNGRPARNPKEKEIPPAA